VNLTLLRRVATAAAVVVFVGILVLSVVGNPPPVGLRNADKYEHFLAYFVLGFALTLAVRSGTPARRARLLGLIALAGCVLYGCALEILQSVVGRECSILDALADTTGSLLGWGAAYFVERAVSRTS